MAAAGVKHKMFCKMTFEISEEPGPLVPLAEYSDDQTRLVEDMSNIMSNLKVTQHRGVNDFSLADDDSGGGVDICSNVCSSKSLTMKIQKGIYSQRPTKQWNPQELADQLAQMAWA